MKTLSKILFVFFIFLITSCNKQHHSTEYKNKVLIVLKKLDTSTQKDIDKEKILDTLSKYLLKHVNDSINRNLIFKVTDKFYYLNNYDKYQKLTKKVLLLAIDKKDTAQIAKSFYNLGEYYDLKTELDSAFSYYCKSIKLYKNLNDNLILGKITLHKAGILFDAGNFTESEVESINALKLLSKTNNTRLIYECYNLIAISLKELNNSKKALEYFDLALKQLDKLETENYTKDKIIQSKVFCYNNIGRVYEKIKQYQEAIHYYIIGLQTKDIKQKYPKSYATLLDNLGYAKMKEGNFKGVETILFESLKIRDSLKIELGIVSSKINIGEYYLYKRDTVKAFAYIKEGLLLSKKFKSSTHSIQSLKLLMENDSNNKTLYTNQYLKLTDSLQEVERLTRNKFARIAYETDLVEENNQVLSKRNTYILSISSLLMLIAIVAFIIYRLKSKNKELIFIKEQQEANEKIYQLMLNQQSETETARNEERNRIAMELHDGIINSIFTSRFNLIQLETNQIGKKELLVKELQNAENEIRKISHDLQKNLLFEDKNLPDILENLVQSQQNEFNTKFDLSVDKYIDWSLVSSTNKIHIYRIIQEAIQNSNKYSKAERCYIILLKTDNKITIRIWDNGIGFNTKKVKQGIGLKNIKERVKILNGELKISSSSGKGTIIEIIF